MIFPSKYYCLLYRWFYILYFTLLAGCASNENPLPAAAIYQQSESILDQLTNQCVTSGKWYCVLNEHIKIDTCDTSLSHTPFDGEGFKIFTQVLKEKYPVSYETDYRDRENGDYTSEYLLGNGNYYLRITRSFRYTSQTFCDEAKAWITYEIVTTSNDIGIVENGRELNFDVQRKSRFDIKELKMVPTADKRVNYGHFRTQNYVRGQISMLEYIEDRVNELLYRARYNDNKYSAKVSRGQAIVAARQAKRAKNLARLEREMMSSIVTTRMNSEFIPASVSDVPQHSSVDVLTTTQTYTSIPVVKPQNIDKKINLTPVKSVAEVQKIDIRPLPPIQSSHVTTTKAKKVTNNKSNSKRQSLAVTYKGKSGKYWFSDGPVQKTYAGDTEEQKALGYTCGSYSTRFLAVFGKYRIHECVGRKLESYDRDIANKYNLPAKFQNW